MTAIPAVIAFVAVIAAATQGNSTAVVLVSTAISAIASCFAAWIGSRNFRSINRTETKVEDAKDRIAVMHELVNGTAMASIEALNVQSRALAVMTQRRDDLIDERERARARDRRSSS